MSCAPIFLYWRDIFGDYFITFNFLEGALWLGCALVCVVFGPRPKLVPAGFWYVLGADFFLFGISDFVEALYSVAIFEPGGEWLLMWKAFCVAMFAGCVTWYAQRRMSK